MKEKTLTHEEKQTLLNTLQIRFERNRVERIVSRREGIIWADVLARLQENEDKLWSLFRMEETGGEPDVVGCDAETGEYIFCDCAPQSPRPSLCYDPAALASRKANKPADSAVGMADAMGIELPDERQYRDLQSLFAFDTKTSSWVKTPNEIRKAGGALFCDFKYNTVFLYHNGAESYYSSRGFRGVLKI